LRCFIYRSLLLLLRYYTVWNRVFTAAHIRQSKLLDEFPVEAGLKGQPRIIPYLPGMESGFCIAMKAELRGGFR
jgi:hypothetical protein